jgi:hypothetical protein
MKVTKRKAVVFLLSDFLDEGFLDSLKIAARKHDLVGINIFDPYEQNFPNIGMLKAEDAETGVKFWIDTSNDHYLKQMNDLNIKKTNKFYKSTQKMGLDIIPISTSEDYVEPLMRFFKKRGKK